ncbi:MAG: SLOG family protein [Oscillospiraceae bacterium]|nr:SLOG family protein [Oscillospiraceae bacterium]
MNNKTVCFSGHRPEKLPGKGDDKREETIYIKKILTEKIRLCISDGYTEFISGVARGIDLWAAQTVLRMKAVYPSVILRCVKPVSDQGINFPDNDKLLLDFILSNADDVICTCQSYTRNCYMIRNRYMVDHSDKLIAFVKNYRSGTGQTINYAMKLNKNVDITDLSDINNLMSFEQLTF